MIRLITVSTWIVTLVVIGISPVAATPALPREVDSFASPVAAEELAYSADHNRLFVREDGSIRVMDTLTGQQIGTELPMHRFSDMDLSADGTCLYAADFGGENIGYSTPKNPPHYVRRYDLRTDTWSTLPAPWIAYRVEGISSDRFLLLEMDQWVDLSLNRWGSSITELSRKACDYDGVMVYNPDGRWLVHAQWSLSSHDMVAYSVGSSSLTFAQGFPPYHSPFQSTYGSLVLSSDNASIYFGKLQLDPFQLDCVTQTFPEIIYAASGDLAFAENAFYDAATCENLGSLGFDSRVYALSPDGLELWAYNPADQTLHYYVVPEPSTLSMLVVASLAVLRRRRGKRLPRAPESFASALVR